MRKLKILTAFLSLTVFFTACGGGGDSPAPSPEPPPVSNNPPILVSENADISEDIDVPINYDASKNGTAFQDADNDTLSYSLSITPENSNLSSDGPVLQGFSSEEGQFEITITANDGQGGSASDTFFVDFSSPLPNDFSPQVDNPNEDQVRKLDTTFEYDTSQRDGINTFIDFDGDTLTYSVTLNPEIPGLTSDGPIISGAASELGSAEVTVVASDGRGGQAEDVFTLSIVDNLPPQLQNPNPDQPADQNEPFEYDVSQAGTTFVDPEGDEITYNISFEFPVDGLSVDGPIISGTPSNAAFTLVFVTATDSQGNVSEQDQFVLDIFPDFSFQGRPNLPATPFNYAAPDLPLHFTDPEHPLGNVVITDNTPSSNPITNEGATLGRVLFYDLRLSQDDFLSCAFCHSQSIAFSDAGIQSSGFGGSTDRHSMSLANANYYQRGKFFWDERAETLEEQVLQPIESPIEMGTTVPAVIEKLVDTDFYAGLFEDAFGSPEITADGMAKAMAQFIRSMKSFQSKYDEGVPIGFSNFTEQESLGHRLFSSDAPGSTRTLSCNQCHTTAAHVADTIHNTGLDLETSVDEGAGNGAFKVPSLRNIAVTSPYMHDGRFFSLEEVIDFYDSGVQDHLHLDENYKDSAGNVQQLNLTDEEKAALVAFLNTLTDESFLSDEKFSDPFF